MTTLVDDQPQSHDDHIEVCAMLEDALTKARRGQYHWIALVAGNGTDHDIHVAGIEHDVAILGGVDEMHFRLLSGQEGECA